MTPKTYQSLLPGSNRIKVQAAVDLAEEEKRIEADLRGRIERALMEGFWQCQDCDRMCDRIEGENGQPAHCSRCGGHRLQWNNPAWKSIDETKLINPGEL